jgi:hypothetical protein
MLYVNIETGRERDFDDSMPIPKEYVKKDKSKISFEGKHHTEQTKKRIGEINRIKMTGKHWFNDGENSVLAFECPDGFVQGRLNKK